MKKMGTMMASQMKNVKLKVKVRLIGLGNVLTGT
jgi:hypothetical protein